MTAGRLRVLGDGRAGGSFARALGAAGWTVDGPYGRDEFPDGPGVGVDLVLICVSDAAVAEVARALPPRSDRVVAHVSGALGLDVLDGHPRVAAVHPLVSLPTAELGAVRLAAGAWFAVAGDPIAERVVEDLAGRSFRIDDEQRARYHAAACIASNHLVALLGQVQRVGAAAGAPFEAYLDLVRGTVENVAVLGPRAALTGPAARGDIPTVERHRLALGEMVPSELATYDALVAEARRLAGGRS